MEEKPEYVEELYRYHFEDLEVGMNELYSHTVTESDVRLYAALSGDNNPVHLDEDFAKHTPFEGRIAHGFLSMGFISALFGTRLPGPGCVFVSQSIRFKAAVRIGDTVVARIRLTELSPRKRIATFETTCTVDGKPVITGEAEIYVPKREP